MKRIKYTLLLPIGLAIIFLGAYLFHGTPKKTIPKRRTPIQLIERTARKVSNQKVDLVQAVSIDTRTNFNKVDLAENGRTIKVPQTFAQEISSIDPIHVPSLFKLELEKKENIDVQKIFSIALEKSESIQVPQLLQIALENASTSEIQKILAVALEHADKLNCTNLLYVTYASLSKITAKNISSQKLIDWKDEWYYKFSAKNGSRLWWILKLAKEKAEAGESVEDLKKLFDETMQKWLEEEEDNEP